MLLYERSGRASSGSIRPQRPRLWPLWTGSAVSTAKSTTGGRYQLAKGGLLLRTKAGCRATGWHLHTDLPELRKPLLGRQRGSYYQKVELHTKHSNRSLSKRVIPKHH